MSAFSPQGWLPSSPPAAHRLPLTGPQPPQTPASSTFCPQLDEPTAFLELKRRLASASQVMGLVDANNFYVQCERLFHPELLERPLVVLSSPTGCAISRCAYSKTLGIQMSEPRFSIQERFGHLRPKIHFRVANFELYQDLSDRMLHTIAASLTQFDVRAYSIDECFFYSPKPVASHATLRTQIEGLMSHLNSWLQLPTCVGLAPNKTLAKLCNHWAKKHPKFLGFCNLFSLPSGMLFELLNQTAVDEVWGIGHASAQKLHALGVHTVWSFMIWGRMHPESPLFRAPLRATYNELWGHCQIHFDTISQSASMQKQHTYGHPVDDPLHAKSSLESYFLDVYQRARSRELHLRGLSLLLSTDPFLDPMRQPQVAHAQALFLKSSTGTLGFTQARATFLSCFETLLTQWNTQCLPIKRVGLSLSYVPVPSLVGPLFHAGRFERTPTLSTHSLPLFSQHLSLDTQALPNPKQSYTPKAATESHGDALGEALMGIWQSFGTGSIGFASAHSTPQPSVVGENPLGEALCEHTQCVSTRLPHILTALAQD